MGKGRITVITALVVLSAWTLGAVGLSALAQSPEVAAALPQTSNGYGLCFTREPEENGEFQGAMTYMFDANMYGPRGDAADGFYIVAIDSTGSGWVQGSTGARPSETVRTARRRFVVSNVSMYPLRFAIIRTGGALEYSYGRFLTRARQGLPFSYEEMDGRLMTDPMACLVDLDEEVPEASQCRCPN